MSNARTLASTINSSSQIVVPSGGVNFGTGTDGTGTVAGGVLDDYEEGSFSPSLSVGAASGTASGRYVKVGNLVSIFVYIAGITDITSSNAFQLTLPFTPSNALNSYSGSLMCRYLVYGSSSKDVVTYIDGNTTALRIYLLNSGGSYTGIGYNDFSSTNIGLRLNINLYVD